MIRMPSRIWILRELPFSCSGVFASAEIVSNRRSQTAAKAIDEDPGTIGMPSDSSPSIRHTKKAFSLIELLVVIAVLGIMAALVVPAISSVLRGIEMNRAEQMVQQQLASARQTAIARNRRVEVRFYKFDNPDDIGSTQTFCALQSFLIDDANAATPISRLTKLPASVLMNETAANSPLLRGSDKTWTAGTDPQVSLPGVGSSYTAKTFQFRPDGSTSLSPTEKWFLTLHAATAPGGATTTALPANFATIQIDPVSGSVRTYRP